MIKYRIIIILAICGIGFFSVVYCGSADNSKDKSTLSAVMQSLSWKETDYSLSLLKDGEVVWRLNYDRSKDKPYFYPLRTLDGVNLALERPDDHIWHRGLWFSWKTINGLNYWEENPETGLSPGRTKILKVETKLSKDYSAAVTIQLEYEPEGEDPVMVENRLLSISSPDKEGNYFIDWRMQFSSKDQDVVLDRAVPLKQGGHVGGGYAGLSFRANHIELDSIRYMDSNKWIRNKSLTGYGEDANWMDLSAVTLSGKGESAGLAIFDHPDNQRHPSPWYIWYAEGKHAFFTPAFLYNKPYTLKAGESFSLKYRVFVHSGIGEYNYLNNEYKKYTE